MADRGDPECSRNLLEGKQNNLARANNGLAKDNSKLMEVQEEADRLKARLDALQRWLYWLAIAVVIGTLILIIVVAVLYGKLNHDLTHHSHKPKVGAQLAKILEREKLCLLCDRIRLGPSLEEDDMLKAFTRMDSEEGTQCCVETPTQLLDLLALVSTRAFFIFSVFWEWSVCLFGVVNCLFVCLHVCVSVSYYDLGDRNVS